MNWPTPKTPRNRDSAPDPRVQPAERRPEQPQGAPRRIWLTFLILLLINYLLMRFLFPEPGESVTIPYTAFKEEVARGNVEAIYSQGASVEGRFASPVTWPPKDRRRGARRAAPDRTRA